MGSVLLPPLCAMRAWVASVAKRNPPSDTEQKGMHFESSDEDHRTSLLWKNAGGKYDRVGLAPSETPSPVDTWASTEC